MKRMILTLTSIATMTTLGGLLACGDPPADAASAPLEAGVEDGGPSPGSPGLPGIPGSPGPDVDASSPQLPGVPVTPSSTCALETDTVLMFQGRLVETITAKGKLFTFEANGAAWTSNGMDLTGVAQYAQGPCAGKTAGNCTFETRAYATYPNNRLIEFVTAYGKYYTFEGGVMTSNADLAALPRYGTVCGLAAGAPCKFDTRSFVRFNGKLTESITAYGKQFNFDAEGQGAPWSDNGIDLTSIPRLASGPCKNKAPGTCKLDTRTFGTAASKLVETITAYGLLWRYDATSFVEVQPSGVPLSTVPAWASGPCK